jgi:hypothetical protein
MDAQGADAVTAFARSPLTETTEAEATLRVRDVASLPDLHRHKALSPEFTVKPLTSLSSDGALVDIVVALDDQPAVDRALTTAAQLTQRLGLALRLVSIHRRNGTGAEYSWRRTLLDDARRSLITRHPDLEGRIDARVLVEDATDCALCEEYPHSIAVSATDRSDHHPKRVVRLSAKRLARESEHHSIVVVGPTVDSRWRSGPVAAALSGTPFAGSALSAAAAWARTLGVDLEVLKVLSSTSSALSHADTRQFLRAARSQVDDDQLRMRCHTVVKDDNARAFARFLRDHSCSLVVIATPQARDARRGAINDEMMDLIAKSPCPVWMRSSD